MLDLLIKNFGLIFSLMLLFIASFVGNTALGTFYNTSMLKEMFNKERLLNGLLRGGMVVLGLALMVVIISLLPGVLEAAGLVELVKVASSLSLVSIAGIIVAATIKYAKGMVEKLYKILTGEDYVEQLEESEAPAEEDEEEKPEEQVPADG